MQATIAMIIASIPTVLLVVGIVLATVVLARRGTDHGAHGRDADGHARRNCDGGCK